MSRSPNPRHCKPTMRSPAAWNNSTTGCWRPTGSSQEVQTAAAAAEHMGPALTSTMEARIAGVEAKQAIQAVSSQAAELEEQLDGLVELPSCTTLELVEPAPLAPCVNSAEQAIAMALESSPEIFQADQDAVKAEAGVRVAKVDYLPDVLSRARCRCRHCIRPAGTPRRSCATARASAAAGRCAPPCWRGSAARRWRDPSPTKS